MLIAILIVGLLFFLIGVGLGIAGSVMYSQNKKAGVTPPNTTVGFMIGGLILAVVGLAILTGVFVKPCPKLVTTSVNPNEALILSSV